MKCAGVCTVRAVFSAAVKKKQGHLQGDADKL